MAKGLTGGTLPLALTLTTDDMFESFLTASKSDALLHGHSYTANPISCAAALATLDIYEREALFDRGLVIERRFDHWIEENALGLNLENSRTLGAILAFELPGTGLGGYLHNPERANHFQSKMIEQGVFVRTLGNTAYFVPVLSISEEVLDFSLHAFKKVLAE